VSSGSVVRRARQMRSSRPVERTFRLFEPNAVPALLAFEHAKGSPCVGINDHSDESELATAETTDLVGLVADSGNPLSPKQVHDADPNQLR
jgi:hypothetical protein